MSNPLLPPGAGLPGTDHARNGELRRHFAPGCWMAGITRATVSPAAPSKEPS